jgi:hypothetical protein
VGGPYQAHSKQRRLAPPHCLNCSWAG